MRTHRAESGQVMPMVALLMVVIIGMAAFAIDGSNIYSQHRRFQADLDVAMKVAASEMFDYNPADAVYTNTAKTSIAAAAQILANDGFTNTLTYTTSPNITASGGGFCGNDPTSGITICNPPQSGPFAGSPHYDYVEGYLSRDVGGFFGGVLGLGRVHISVRAVAWHGGFHQPYALIGLDPSGNAVSVGGSGAMTVTGSLMGDSWTSNGGTAVVTGHSDQVQIHSNQIPGQSGTNAGVPSIVDPYPPISVTVTEPVTQVNSGATVPTECMSETLNYLGTTTVPISSTFFFPPADGTPGLIPLGGTLPQGTYYFLPRCDGTSSGSPGVYYSTGGLHPTGQSVVNSFNSVFVLSDQSSFMDTGLTSWVLSAPTSGPYQGIAMTENRTTSEPPCPNGNPTLNLYGNASLSVDGVVDLPCVQISVSGNANATVDGVFVGYDITTWGNGTLIVNYDPFGTPPDKGSVLVE